MTEKNLYTVLGVAPNATAVQIRLAFLTTLKKLHPDRIDREKNPQEWELANELLKELNYAHSILRDNALREAYDRSFTQTTLASSPPPPSKNKQPPPNKASTVPPSAPHNTTRTAPPERTPSDPKQPKSPAPKTPKTAAHFQRIKAGRAGFHTLPRSIQQQLVERVHGKHTDQVAIRRGGIAWNKLIASLASLWFILLFIEASAGTMDQSGLPLLVSLSFIASLLLAFNVHRIVRWYRSPLKRWILITPLYVIETQLDRIWYWPLWDISKINSSQRFHRGNYKHTSVRFRFGRMTLSFRISPKAAYDAMRTALRTFEQNIHNAKAREDWEYFSSHDVFRELDPKVSKCPFKKESHAVFIYCLVLAGFAFALAYAINNSQSIRARDIYVPSQTSLSPLERAQSPVTASITATPAKDFYEPHPSPIKPQRSESNSETPSPESVKPIEPTSTPSPQRALASSLTAETQTSPSKTPSQSIERTKEIAWKSLISQSLSLYQRRLMDRAIEVAIRALDLATTTLGEDHVGVVPALNNMAFLYSAQGAYLQAAPFYQRAIALQEDALGADHPDVANTLSNLAELYRNQGRFSLAEPLFKRALATLEQTVGSNHPDVAAILNNLGLLYTTQHQFKLAEETLTRALQIRETVLGKNHLDAAATMSNLASLYQATGQYEPAELLFTRSLTILKIALNEDHPRLAQALTNIAQLHIIQGQYAQAEPLLKRAIAIQERALGHQNLEIAQSLESLALLYHSTQRTLEAREADKRAAAIRSLKKSDASRE